MIRYVILDNNLIRQLKRLHQAGGMAKAVAEHAEAVIQQWVCGEVKSPRYFIRSTRFGEGRIKNCLKYDLVEACRLLAVMDGEHLIFLFVGSHDECNQWICHNSGWEPRLEKRGNEILEVQHKSLKTRAEEAVSEDDEAAEDCFLREIDERDLRVIFSGICRSRADQQ